jgi:hypothetical protein
MGNSLQQKISEPVQNIKKWFDTIFTQKRIAPTAEQARLAGLHLVVINTKNRDWGWLHLWSWLNQYGKQDKDFFLFWQEDKAFVYLADDDIGMMCKLQWG